MTLIFFIVDILKKEIDREISNQTRSKNMVSHSKYRVQGAKWGYTTNSYCPAMTIVIEYFLVMIKKLSTDVYLT